MAGSVLVDTGFLVALLAEEDIHHAWAVTQASGFPPPWSTCEAVLSEAYHLLQRAETKSISALLDRHALGIAFDLAANLKPVLTMLKKYADVPMSLADACLVRMTEVLADPVLLTTDEDFLVYRRHSRQVIPCAIPGR